MAQINFRIDDNTKTEAEALFGRLGMNMSTAITVFIRQSIAENGIPFLIKAPDPNYDRFVQAGRDYDNGRVNYHYHELPETGSAVRQEVCHEKALA